MNRHRPLTPQPSSWACSLLDSLRIGSAASGAAGEWPAGQAWSGRRRRQWRRWRRGHRPSSTAPPPLVSSFPINFGVLQPDDDDHVCGRGSADRRVRPHGPGGSGRRRVGPAACLSQRSTLRELPPLNSSSSPQVFLSVFCFSLFFYGACLGDRGACEREGTPGASAMRRALTAARPACIPSQPWAWAASTRWLPRRRRSAPRATWRCASGAERWWSSRSRSRAGATSPTVSGCRRVPCQAPPQLQSIAKEPPASAAYVSDMPPPLPSTAPHPAALVILLLLLMQGATGVVSPTQARCCGLPLPLELQKAPGGTHR